MPKFLAAVLEEHKPYISKIISREQLYDKYIVQGLHQKAIALECGVRQGSISRALLKYGIPTRPRNSFAFHDVSREKNPGWKGAAASYFTLHQRLRRHLGHASHCEFCGIDGTDIEYEWANLTGKYDDPKDYIQSCRSCHKKFDRIYTNCGNADLTHCKRGHAFDEDNTYIHKKSGKRRCKSCRRVYQKMWIKK